MDCSDATTDACCVFTAARSVPMGTDYVSTTACHATTLMADGTLCGASGIGKRTMGALGGIKKSRQSLRRELYRENTPVGGDGFEPPTLCL